MDIQRATREWVSAMKEYYDSRDEDDLDQINLRGYFAGWSERDIHEFVNNLHENNETDPIKMDAPTQKSIPTTKVSQGDIGYFSRPPDKFRSRPDPI